MRQFSTLPSSHYTPVNSEPASVSAVITEETEDKANRRRNMVQVKFTNSLSLKPNNNPLYPESQTTCITKQIKEIFAQPLININITCMRDKAIILVNKNHM